VRDNAGAADFELSAAEVLALESAFPRSAPPRELPTN